MYDLVQTIYKMKTFKKEKKTFKLPFATCP